MTRSRPGAEPAGYLLVSGASERIRRWAGGGLVEVDVCPLGSWWTVLLPTGPAASSQAPYDDAVTMLLNRPVPRRLCPAIGFAVIGDRALITVHSKRLRRRQGWLAWRAGAGSVPPDPLPPAPVVALLRAAEKDDPGSWRTVRTLLDDPAGTPVELLLDLLEVLDLPGADCLTAGRLPTPDAASAVRIAPNARRVAAFDAMVGDERDNESELRNTRTARPLGEETAVHPRRPPAGQPRRPAARPGAPDPRSRREAP